MISVYDLKPKFQSLLRPSVRYAANKHITPNQITLAALMLSCITGAYIWLSSGSKYSLLCVPITLFLRMALNAMDGMLAREFNLSSRVGQILNELGDVISDVVLYLPFTVIVGLTPSLIVIFIILAILTEFSGILSQVIIGTRRYDGPMGKSDRALLFGAISLLVSLKMLDMYWINFLLVASCLLAVWTIWNRLRPALSSRS